ncbi:Aldo/keto reductase [Rickenella mellea]|uniref:Aldo/keto reductase n=1 Tax=Rickenella mellea TaxID=50990 RepID=A0A4Y7PT37_9AGAM|nr:Aldo/keto reductase [Rickenella mellea]
MLYRFLGNSGLKISVISLGGWLTHGVHTDDDITFTTLKAAYEGSGGRAETVLGKALKHFAWDREDVVISTKFLGINGEASAYLFPVGMWLYSCSLKRLQLEYVDLMLITPTNTPMEEVVRAFNHLINTGQAEWSAEESAGAWRVADKHHLIGPLMEQPEYVYFPLRGGILTGKRVAKSRPIAEKLVATSGELALTWVIRNEHVSSAIIGASGVVQLEENLGAVAVVEKLTDAVVKEMEEVMGTTSTGPPMRY